MSRKRVGIIGTNGIPAAYGGFETLVSNIHSVISEKHHVIVFCSRKAVKGMKYYGKTRLIRIPLSANGLQSFIYDFLSIVYALFKCDVLIVLGLGGGFALPLIPFFRKKIVYNPGGVEVSKVRGIKSLAVLETYMKLIFDHGFYRVADFVVLDNQAFFSALSRYSHKLRLIEYGGESSMSHDIRRWEGPYSDYDISVSRSQEDMNLEMVLEAYTEVGRNLVLVSNWSASQYGRRLWSLYKGKFPNIYLHEAVYDKTLLNSMRNGASLYIHSHSLCGTAPSLVEAMSLGKAVVCFDVVTNRFSTENQGFYFKSKNELINLLLRLNSNDIARNGELMGSIAERRYNWRIIAEKYLELI